MGMNGTPPSTNAMSSNKMSLMERFPNSFLAYPPPLDVDSTSSLGAVEFSVYNQVLHLDQSQTQVIKTQVYCKVNWLQSV